MEIVCLLLLLYCLILSRRISRIPKPTLFQRLDDEYSSGSRVPVIKGLSPENAKARPGPIAAQYLRTK